MYNKSRRELLVITLQRFTRHISISLGGFAQRLSSDSAQKSQHYFQVSPRAPCSVTIVWLPSKGARTNKSTYRELSTPSNSKATPIPLVKFPSRVVSALNPYLGLHNERGLLLEKGVLVVHSAVNAAPKFYCKNPSDTFLFRRLRAASYSRLRDDPAYYTAPGGTDV